MGSTSESEIQAIMKDLYENEVPMIGVEDPVVFARISKTTNFVGRSKEFAVQYGVSPGISASISDAIDNADAEAFDYFAVTRRKGFVVMHVDTDAYESCRDDGAKVDYLRRCVETARRTAKWQLNRMFYGNGGGALARLDASAGGGGTSTLLVQDRHDLYFLSPRMVLVSSDTDGTSGSVDANPGVVGSVNRRTGEIVIASGNWNASFANNDRLFLEGDFGAHFHGFRAWIPDSDPSATTFFGVDRTDDPMRLAGQRIPAETEDGTLENYLLRVTTEVGVQAANKKLVLYWHPTHLNQLIRDLGSKVEYTRMMGRDSSGATFDIGGRSVTFLCGGMELECVGDRDAPRHRGFLCDESMMSLEGMGECPRVATYGDDTNQWLRVTNSDSMEGRIVFKGNYVFHAPGHFANLDLSALTNPS